MIRSSGEGHYTDEDAKANLAGKTSRNLRLFKGHYIKILKPMKSFDGRKLKAGTICWLLPFPTGQLYLFEKPGHMTPIYMDAVEGTDFEFAEKKP